jgi:hypothetical protein
MITIRQSQMDRFAEVAREDYYDRLCQYFRTNLPDFVARFDDAQLRAGVAEAVPVARGYGLESGTAIARYVGLALAAGPGFHTNEAIRNFLTRPGHDPEDLLRWLLVRMKEDGEARLSSPPSP